MHRMGETGVGSSPYPTGILPPMRHVTSRPRRARIGAFIARALLALTALGGGARPGSLPTMLPAQPALPALPQPVGFVNDFAGVIPAETRARLEDLSRRVQAATGGELAIVTLRDLEGRPVEETALRIGREWRVGAKADIGDRTRNAGVVLLVVPKETSSDGRGHCRIETGQGTEGFITDATSGALCREAIPYFQRQDYGAAIELIATRIAQRFATEFGTSIDGVPTAQRSRAPQGGGAAPSIAMLLVIFLVLMIMSAVGGRRRRGCGGCIPVPIVGPPVVVSPGWHRGGWGGGGFGGGFGGGGFGGFGGGGGFSGGGGGSSW